MRTPMAAKTKVTLAVGFATFLFGSLGAAYVGSRQAATSTKAPPSEPLPVVLYAARPIPVGTAGPSALAQSLVRTKSVAPASVPAEALIQSAQLSGRVAASDIPEGTILTEDMFPAPQTRIGTLVIPEGKRALAVELEPVAGVAGFVGAGDRIDIYGVANGGRSAAGVHLVLQSVEVLNVNGTGLPARQGLPSGPNLVYLLAVTPAEAERLIYLTKFEQLYFDLVAKGEPPVTTSGSGPDQALQAL